jgi:hypothetical protein
MDWATFWANFSQTHLASLISGDIFTKSSEGSFLKLA